jgi:hypothetical protein
MVDPRLATANNDLSTVSHAPEVRQSSLNGSLTVENVVNVPLTNCPISPTEYSALRSCCDPLDDSEDPLGISCYRSVLAFIEQRQ